MAGVTSDACSRGKVWASLCESIGAHATVAQHLGQQSTWLWRDAEKEFGLLRHSLQRRNIDHQQCGDASSLPQQLLFSIKGADEPARLPKHAPVNWAPIVSGCGWSCLWFIAWCGTAEEEQSS